MFLKKDFFFQRRAAAKLSTEKQDPIGVHDRGSDVWRTISLAQSGFHRVGLRLHLDRVVQIATQHYATGLGSSHRITLRADGNDECHLF